MLLALHLMVETKAPVEASPTLRAVLAAISDPPLVNLLLAGLIAWAAHSSVAGVLFIASVAGSGVAAPEAALAMVLGANVGSAINPLLQASGGDPEDRAKLRLPLGNLMNRIIGALLVLAALIQATTLLQALDPAPVRLVANAHLAFNLAAAVLAFRCSRPPPRCCAGCCQTARSPPARARRATSIPRRSPPLPSRSSCRRMRERPAPWCWGRRRCGRRSARPPGGSLRLTASRPRRASPPRGCCWMRCAI
jgi:phosphate:Na+ symporter